MQLVNNHLNAFFELLRAGLWENENPEIRIDGTTNWQEVYRLATEQSVLGLVLAGLEHSDVKPPKELLLQWIGEVQVIEQQNKKMNTFIAGIIEKMRKEDIYALLVKGQGIAQCYQKPFWRSCGDIDLLLNDDNYNKAFQFFLPIASKINDENTNLKHVSMTVDGWIVELHGTLRSGLWKGWDREIDKSQRNVFFGGNVRSWSNGNTQVFMPGEDEDVFFVFSHILQHFYQEGIGLRQLCDWCRLLRTYKDSLNYELLEQRIKRAGIMSEWKVYAALAVDYLGMPIDSMPFYLFDTKLSRKAECVMNFILQTGNFGHNRDYSYYNNYPYIVYKAISFWKHTEDFVTYFRLFPPNAMKVYGNMIKMGLKYVVKRK